MPVDRNRWGRTVIEGSWPNWHCPSCEGGYLREPENSVRHAHTARSHREASSPHVHPEEFEYRFVGLLRCDNRHCLEVVIVAGTGGEMRIQGEEFDELVVCFHPKYVSPSPHLIPLHNIYPKEVRTELALAFSASWGDLASAGNHIRSVVEHLLSHLGISATVGPGKFVSLHSRIQHQQTPVDIRDALMATKWIGNAASHSGTPLSREDVFDGLDTVEFALDYLFNKEKRRVADLIQSINAAKTPLSAGNP